LALVERTEERDDGTELHRLKGELALQKQSKMGSEKSKVEEAEGYFLRARED